MLTKVIYDAAVIASDRSGIPTDWIVAQWAHETGNFTSELCVNYCNYAGITQIESNDLPQPDGNYYYRKFPDVVAFGTYFGKYLLLLDGIENAADSLESYITCLNFNGYFGADYDEYLSACCYWLKYYEKELFNYGNAEAFT